MGKGKPFCASKIAKKKLGLGYMGPGRPGKLGKLTGMTSALMMNYQKKQQRFNEFGRKRIPKAKMRGIFGVPGLGLQVRCFFLQVQCSSYYLTKVFFVLNRHIFIVFIS